MNGSKQSAAQAAHAPAEVRTGLAKKEFGARKEACRRITSAEVADCIALVAA
ncbi:MULTISPECIES: hypothetical protein [Xanthomonas]|uniref:hypothetical protein n=1 Tax=Xanthomonas TaxID=338 RepID=UPI0003B0B17A|nr:MULTISPECIES: hypothetical protein [Xanthomonas]CDF63100.1 Hypothetical protein XFF4834R_chr36760 [Xanthomonas citri pv. fuscans]